MRRNSDGTDCNACFARDCNCSCKTCEAARTHNRNKSDRELFVANFKAAIQADKDAKKE